MDARQLHRAIWPIAARVEPLARRVTLHARVLLALFGDCNNNKRLDGCETPTLNDLVNCGSCGTTCSNNHITRACTAGSCESGVCDAGYSDCNNNKQADGCETAGTCNPFASTGADGALSVLSGVVTLTPGVYHYTTINIAAGATVRPSSGSGVLELRATGSVQINGRVDVTGGNGADAISGQSCYTGGGNGGVNGAPFPGTSGNTQCAQPGAGGTALAVGSNGGPALGRSCNAIGGNNGGGAGGGVVCEFAACLHSPV
eukprot:TRINITY_DN4869_c0_g1_i13.p1 TRINITY_DN4869_c0_g1~~TRINITY_DN4869_c0_g1_i13.p1  ORF type:complete len:259 (+),score=43.24 TRINITY_DN4869_c0_g1_i13:483-1259(+)